MQADCTELLYVPVSVVSMPLLLFIFASSEIQCYSPCIAKSGNIVFILFKLHLDLELNLSLHLSVTKLIFTPPLFVNPLRPIQIIKWMVRNSLQQS